MSCLLLIMFLQTLVHIVLSATYGRNLFEIICCYIHLNFDLIKMTFLQKEGDTLGQVNCSHSWYAKILSTVRAPQYCRVELGPPR